MATTYAKLRFLADNLLTTSNMTASSQAAGRIGGVQKTGTGSANMKAVGSFTGAADLTVIVQIDSLGTGEIGSSTFRWKTSATVSGWEATGVTTATTPTTLGTDGKQIAFEAGTGADFVLDDTWVFACYAIYSPARMLDLDRDLRYRSGGWSTLLVNGGFDSAVTSWTPANCTLASIAGGVSGNCCELTRTASTEQGAYQDFTSVAGARYYLRGYIKSGTSGNETGRLAAYTSGGSTLALTNITTSTSWQQVIVNFVATTTTTRIWIYKPTATAGTMLFDSIEVFRVPTFTIDLGSAQSITAVLLQDHNFSSSAVVKIEANTSDAWSSPAYSLTLTQTDDPIISYISQSYRYWRFYVQDVDNTDGYIEIGEMYLGTYTGFASESSRLPWGSQRTNTYNRLESKSYVGKTRRRVWTQQEEIPISLPLLDNTDWETLKALYESLHNPTTGTISPLWLHYFYDTASECFLVDWLTDLPRTFKSYGFNVVTLSFAEVVTTK